MKTAARNTLTTASDILKKIHCTLQSPWYSYIDIVNHE